MSIPIWCPTCSAATAHGSQGDQVCCLVCGHKRPDDVPLLIAQVQEMRRCDWCNETKPADHPCRGGSLSDRDTPERP